MVYRDKIWARTTYTMYIGTYIHVSCSTPAVSLHRECNKPHRGWLSADWSALPRSLEGDRVCSLIQSIRWMFNGDTFLLKMHYFLSRLKVTGKIIRKKKKNHKQVKIYSRFQLEEEKKCMYLDKISKKRYIMRLPFSLPILSLWIGSSCCWCHGVYKSMIN